MAREGESARLEPPLAQLQQQQLLLQSQGLPPQQ